MPSILCSCNDILLEHSAITIIATTSLLANRPCVRAGLERLIEPMLTALMQDAFATGTLDRCRGSFMEYWIPVVSL